MPYSEQELAEIERDPERLRAYFWHMAQHWRRLAARKREKSRATGRLHPVTNYLPAFEDGHDEVHWANTLDRCSDLLLEHIDAFVETTVVKPSDLGQSSRDP